MIIRSKAPLRLGLAGGGTDVSPYSDLYGGMVLNATVNLFAHCTLEETSDGRITVNSFDSNCFKSYPSGESLQIDGDASLIKGVYNRIQRDFHIGPKSFCITTYSDAPAGSGLGRKEENGLFDNKSHDSGSDGCRYAGGLGTRLRSVVSDVPKCMAPVGNRPFLSILLDQIAQLPEVGKVILSVGYLRKAIFDWIESNASRYPFKIDFAVEETPLGTGGGIRLALNKCREEEVLVINGDTFFDINPELLLRDRGASVVVALKEMSDFDRYGKVECDGENGVVRRQ